MKALILCEKPSVAQDFARALSAVKKEGYFESSEYFITYAFGHLFEIDDGVVDKEWKLDSLPVFPERFRYKLRDGAGKQFKVIKELLSKAKEVIIATDAGREGELIARLILLMAGWKRWENTYRLWTSSALTKDVIRRELKNLKPAKEFDSLYFCALARQHSDWLVGINLTRAVSLKSSGGVWSVGRVQTPTLALVVERDREIENFKPEPYWIVKAMYDKGGQRYEGVLLFKQRAGDRPDEGDDDEEREEGERLTEERAKSIVEVVAKALEHKVEKVIKRREREYAPSLFSLTTLQKEANKVYGFSAQKTLEIAQRLYEEHKCISYPRTDAEHLAEENKGLVKQVLTLLGRQDLAEVVDRVGRRVFDNSKLTDHHAIIPLAPIPESAKEDERKLYELILKRFLAVFYPPYEYERTQVWTRSGSYLFFSQGTRVIALGWRELYEKPKDKLLPALKEGERVELVKVWSEQRFTKPPARYTEGALVKKMESLNLGTPATRASIIETLKKRGYLILNKKHLLSTSKGRELIQKLTKLESALVKPELTSEWERKLEAIYKNKLGEKGYQEFVSSIKSFVREEVQKTLKEDFRHEGAKGQGQKNSPKAYRKAYKKRQGGGFGRKGRGKGKGKR